YKELQESRREKKPDIFFEKLLVPAKRTKQQEEKPHSPKTASTPGRGITLEEQYPGLADTIKAARDFGHNDQAIEQWIGQQRERGRAAGMDEQAIDKWLGKASPQATTPSQSSR